MTAANPAKPQVDQARIVSAATSLGLIGSGAGSVARLMKLLCDPQVSGAEIAALIENHPVLCARVLRVANSAYYGQPRSITTIKQAVPVLGLSAIRGVAAAACIDRAASHNGDDPIDMAAMLRHSLATAVAADALARSHCEALAAEAFIAGVLHNLGVAVQVSIDASGIGAMLASLRSQAAQSIRALEAEHTTVRHEHCGAVVLDAWQLPESLVAVAAHHHLPADAPAVHRNLVSLVNLGTTLALATGHTFALEPTRMPHDPAALQQLGLTEGDLDPVTADLPERVENLRRALLG